MVLGSVKDKITKEYLRQSQIKNKIHTKANAPNLNHWNAYHLPCWIGYRQKQRPHWNAYHLPRWIRYKPKQTPALERLLFAPVGLIQTKATPTICPAGLIQTTGTLTICPVGLDTDNWNAYYLPRWIGYRQLEHLPFALLDWIQTKANAHTGTLTICPVGLIQTTGTLTICPAGLDTDNWNAYYLPCWIGYRPKQTPTLELLLFAPLD